MSDFWRPGSISGYYWPMPVTNHYSCRLAFRVAENPAPLACLFENIIGAVVVGKKGSSKQRVPVVTVQFPVEFNVATARNMDSRQLVSAVCV